MGNLKNLGIGKALFFASPKLLPKATSSSLHKIMDVAIYGSGKLPSAKTSAVFALSKFKNREKAINFLISSMISVSGAQGFLTNLGGVASLAISLPANIAAMAMAQAHLVATIAHLRGYDITDSRVRNAISMCLMGEEEIENHIAASRIPSTPFAVATAPMADPKLHETIDKLVTNSLLGAASGKHALVLLAKKVPMVGGGIGAVQDSWRSWEIAKYAKKQFPARNQLAGK